MPTATAEKPKRAKTRNSSAQGMIDDLKALKEFLQQGHTLEEAAAAGFCRIKPFPKSTEAETAKAARAALALNRAKFAAFLGVSSQSVKAWEQGVKIPTPPVRLLLKHIADNPQHWRGLVPT